MSDQYEKGVLKVLRYVYNQMERCRNADFDALGITSSQASVMMFLFKNRKHEVTQQSVQAALLLSHPTITGLMKRLEAKGFITRKNSPADFRCKYVKLTKKGCDIERGLKTNMKRMQDRALVGLSQEELDNLEKSLCVIAENLRKEEDMLAAERIIQDIKERTKEEEKEENFSVSCNSKSAESALLLYLLLGPSLHVPHGNNGSERHHDRGQDRRNNGRHTVQRAHKREEIVQRVVEDADHNAAENLNGHTARSGVLVCKRHRKQQHD